MKQRQHLGKHLLWLLIFSSCGKLFEFGIDISERAHFHENGSGHFVLVVDLSKAEKFIQTASYVATGKAKTIQAIVRRAFQKTGVRLKQISGIDHVATGRDATMLHFKLSFHFKSIKALNEAMRKIYAHVDHPRLIYFKIDAHHLERIDTQSIAQLIAHYEEKDDSYIHSFDLKTFFKDFVYKTVYSFDKEIKHVSNKRSRIAKNHKKVILKQCLLSEEEKRLSLGNKISF